MEQRQYRPSKLIQFNWNLAYMILMKFRTVVIFEAESERIRWYVDKEAPVEVTEYIITECSTYYARLELGLNVHAVDEVISTHMDAQTQLEAIEFIFGYLAAKITAPEHEAHVSHESNDPLEFLFNHLSAKVMKVMAITEKDVSEFPDDSIASMFSTMVKKPILH